jgi:prepilin-type N-terminal cleavage/methylation domain-containing protein
MHKQRGFTIIEILIALAVAGLMVLLVFLAVPALQRTTRNNVRHKDAGLLLAGVVNSRAESTNGGLPDTCNTTQADCFLRDIALGYYKEPDASSPTVSASFIKLDHPYTSADAQLHVGDDDATDRVVLYSYAICDESGSSPTGQFASPQSVVVTYALETFNDIAMQCKQI